MTGSTTGSATGGTNGKNPVAKVKKPPACDGCKLKRVLCHPNPAGCPRCREKGIECVTSPVVRRRPGTVKNARSVASASSAHPSPNNDFSPNVSVSPHNDPAATSGSSYPPLSHANSSIGASSSSIRKQFDAFDAANTRIQPVDQWPTSVIADLFRLSVHLPYHYHPLLHYDRLHRDLQRVNYVLASLSPESRVLSMCILLNTALLSLDPFIVGQEASLRTLDDLRKASSATDLREFGRRRKAIISSLKRETHAEAVRIGITVYPSEDNAMSCHLLDLFDTKHYDEDPENRPSRYFSSAYLAHFREMTHVLTNKEFDPTRFSVLLMEEALVALRTQVPFNITADDQRNFTNHETMPIAELARKAEADGHTVYEELWKITGHFADNIVVFCREINDKLTGHFARRSPVSEAVLMSMVANLDQIELIRKQVRAATRPLILETAYQMFPQQHVPANPTSRSRLSFLLRVCTFVLDLSSCCVSCAMHHELQRRLKARTNEGEPVKPASYWQRIELLSKQIHELALEECLAVMQDLSNVPSLVHITHIKILDIHGWASLLVEQAAAQPVLEPSLIQALQSCANVIRLYGFSWDDRRSSALLSVIELYLPNTPPNPAPISQTTLPPLNSNTVATSSTSNPNSNHLGGFPMTTADLLALQMPNQGPSPVQQDIDLSFMTDEWINSTLISMHWFDPSGGMIHPQTGLN